MLNINRRRQRMMRQSRGISDKKRKIKKEWESYFQDIYKFILCTEINEQALKIIEVSTASENKKKSK